MFKLDKYLTTAFLASMLLGFVIMFVRNSYVPSVIRSNAARVMLNDACSKISECRGISVSGVYNDEHGMELPRITIKIPLKNKEASEPAVNKTIAEAINYMGMANRWVYKNYQLEVQYVQ